MKNGKSLTQVIFLALFITFVFNSCKKDDKDAPKQPINYNTGFIKTPDQLYGSIPNAPAPPPSGSLPASFFLPIPSIAFDQGGQGSCASVATAMAKSILDFDQKGTAYINNGITYSPAYLFNQVHSNPNDCTKGSYLPDNFNLLRDEGVCGITEMPYHDHDCTTPPSVSQKNMASSNKIDHYFKIDPINVSWIKQYIFAGLPVIVAFQTDENFHKKSDNSVWKSFGWSFLGNHAAVLYGWDDSKGAFKLLNSWGESWKENGTGWVDYGFVQGGTSLLYGKIFTEAYILQNGASTQGSKISITGNCPAEVQVGQSQAFNMTIHNIGNTAFSATDLKITNNSDGVFSFTGGKPSLPITIPASGSKNVSLTFAPTTVSNYNATFEVTSNASSGNNTSPLSGAGVNGTSQTKVIRLTKTTCTDVQINQSSNFTLTVHNDGNTSFTINGITSSNPAYNVQSFSSQTVAAGSSVNYTIQFSPTAVQSYSTTLTVNSTATTGVNTVSVTATGLSGGGGGITVTPTVGTFTDCNYGSATRTLSLNGWSSSSFATNNYRIKVKSYNQNTGDITFSVKRCNGQNIQELISVSIYDMNPNVTDGPTIESGFAGDVEVTLTRNISFAGSDTKQFIAIVETIGSWTDPNYCTQEITISW
jgi:hypothetical protein